MKKKPIRLTYDTFPGMSLKKHALFIIFNAFICLLLIAHVPMKLLSQAINPSVQWQTLNTQHFQIIHPPNLHHEALHLASFADDTYKTLSQKYKSFFKKPFTILLRQDIHKPNGYFTVLPYPHIVLYITPWIHNITEATRDELKLLFIHELVHALTLNKRTGPIASALAIISNKSLLSATLPTLFWEGISILEESHDLSGRLNDVIFYQHFLQDLHASSYHIPIAAIEGRRYYYPYRRSPYHYGAFFTRYLHQKHGSDDLITFYHQATGYAPYMYPILFKKVFGNSLKNEWYAWQDDVKSSEQKNPTFPSTPLTPSKPITTTDDHKDNLKYKEGFLYYFHNNNLASTALYQIDPDTQKRTCILTNTGFTDYDVTNSKLALILQIHRTYSSKYEPYLIDLKTHQKQKLPFEGVQAIAFKNPETLIMTLHQGMRTHVIQYALNNKQITIILPTHPQKTYGRIACNSKLIAIEERSKVKPESIQLRLFNHDYTQTFLIGKQQGFKHVIHPAFHPQKPLLFFSALKHDDKAYRFYTFNTQTHTLHQILIKSRTPLSYPTPSPKNTNELYALSHNAKGYDITHIQPSKTEGLTTAPIQRSPHHINPQYLSLDTIPTSAYQSSPAKTLPLEKSFRLGNRTLGFNTRHIHYSWQWVLAPLSLHSLYLYTGFHYKSLSPFIKIAYTNQTWPYQIWRLSVQRNEIYNVFVEDKAFIRHTAHYKNGAFVLRNETSLGGSRGILETRNDKGKFRLYRAWNPILLAFDNTQDFTAAHQIRFGLHLQEGNVIVPYHAYITTLSAVYYYRPDPKQSEFHPLLNFGLHGSKRLIKHTLMDASFHHIYSFRDPILSTPNIIPSKIHRLTPFSLDHVTLPSHGSTPSTHAFASLKAGLHQRLFTLQKGYAAYLPFYLQACWASLYGSISKPYNHLLSYQEHPFLYETQLKLTLDMDLFYRLKTLFFLTTAYNPLDDPLKWDSYKFGFNFDLAI